MSQSDKTIEQAINLFFKGAEAHQAKKDAASKAVLRQYENEQDSLVQKDNAKNHIVQKVFSDYAAVIEPLLDTLESLSPAVKGKQFFVSTDFRATAGENKGRAAEIFVFYTFSFAPTQYSKNKPPPVAKVLNREDKVRYLANSMNHVLYISISPDGPKGEESITSEFIKFRPAASNRPRSVLSDSFPVSRRKGEYHMYDSKYLQSHDHIEEVSTVIGAWVNEVASDRMIEVRNILANAPLKIHQRKNKAALKTAAPS